MFFASILIIVTWIFIVNIYRNKKKVPPNYPPGPPCLPIIGNLHIINIKKPYLTLEKLAKKYGPVYSLQLGTQKMVVLCGYETVKDALINHAEVFSARADVPIFMQATKGYGILMANGDNWKAMRRFTFSTLRCFGMGKKTIEERITEECNYLVERIKIYRGKPFNTNMILNASVANIIVSILIGHRFEYNDPKLWRLLKIVNESNRIAGTPVVVLYNAFPSLFKWLPGSHNEFFTNMKETHDFARETFMKQRDQLDANDTKSFIEEFLVKQKEEKNGSEKYFSDSNLATLVVDLFAAGTETTSTTLQWGLLLMAKYPEIQRNVQDEIKKVIGSANPCSTHRKQMPYTNAVIHEIQRFASVLPMGGPHATTQDVILRGFLIPKGTHIIPLLYSVLRDKEHFEKAEDFYPQHFLDSDGNFVKNEAFIPFMAGKRNCVGEELARMELFLFFTTLLQNFTFQAPPGATLEITADLGFTGPPQKHDICAIVHNENLANM